MKDSGWPHAPPHHLGSVHSYLITASTYQKEHYFRDPDRLDVLQRGLLKLAGEFHWQLEAWAAFSNHYHFVGRPVNQVDASSLRPMLSQLHEKTAKWINKRDEKPGRKVWHNFHDTILSFEKSYLARLNYVHRNAVHHGLVSRAEDYDWCSAAWFKRTADPAFVKTVSSFKLDRVKVSDDYHPEVAS